MGFAIITAVQLAFSSSAEGRHGPVVFSGNKLNLFRCPETGSPEGVILIERKILSHRY